MRVFVAGASGVIGRPLVRLLVADGHAVAGMTRSTANAEAIRALGAEPVVCDVYDAAALRDAVHAFAPDAVINQLTDLPDAADEIAASLDANSRIRTVGNANLVAALDGAKYLAQSVAFDLPGKHGEAIAQLERSVLERGGVVLRYGYFYGPGTYSDGSDALPPEPRVHVEHAARATVDALDAPSGVIVVAD